IISGYQALKDTMIGLGEEFSGRATYPLLMITLGYGVLSTSGHRWKEMRRVTLMTLKNFGMGRRSIEERVREEAEKLVEMFKKCKERVQKEIDEVVGQDRWSSVEDRQNLPYTDAVIHEIQRNMDLAPIAVPHKMMCDTEYNGYVIPKGVMVFPLLSSVLIDPKMWKNPNCFDPENFLDADGRFQKNDAFVVFGMGKRACLGEALARIELFIFFTSLLQHFTFKATVPLEELDTTPTKCSFGCMPRTYDCYAIPRK
uniref:Uncharacterized protein n=1 Tax=Sinocyclocheilus anshuiensis TaxID=1608454 RepID=A0A671NMI6_9TELE